MQGYISNLNFRIMTSGVPSIRISGVLKNSHVFYLFAFQIPYAHKLEKQELLKMINEAIQVPFQPIGVSGFQ